MLKRILFGMILGMVVVTLMVTTVSVKRGLAQEIQGLIPSPQDILIETVDPVTKVAKSAFCIGANAIDVKLTNSSTYRHYVYVIDRNAAGAEQTLYSGWLEPGTTYYLSTLLNTQLEVTGPVGTETLRLDVGEAGQSMAGRSVTYAVQDCGTNPPDGGTGSAIISAQIHPTVIPQGGKGTITLRTNVASQASRSYYFEISNSWGQLWKRLPVNKRAQAPYRVTLAVGQTTKPGMLTYRVKLWQAAGTAGGRKVLATTRFSFRVVQSGWGPTPYDPNYQDPSMVPFEPGYPCPPAWDPYSSGMSSPGMPYSPGLPYVIPSQGAYPGTSYPLGMPGDRQIE